MNVPEDFTIYRAKDDEVFKGLLSKAGVPASFRRSRETTAIPDESAFGDAVEFAVKENGDWTLYGARALVCWCWKREAISITLRVEGKKYKAPDPGEGNWPDKAHPWDKLTEDWALEMVAPPRFENHIGMIRALDLPSLEYLEKTYVQQSLPVTSVHSQPHGQENTAIPTDGENHTSESSSSLQPKVTIDQANCQIDSGLLRPSQNPEINGAPSTQGAKKKPFLFSKSQLTSALFPAIFDPRHESSYCAGSGEKYIQHGLVVISGQTGSLKSQLLRSLLKTYLASFNLAAWGKPGRLPHLITIEDPIESPLVDPEQFAKQMENAGHRQFDFTPREIGRDVTTLDEGLLHALRQTPTAVVVGEVRREDDWKSLLAFAATGHLCFTTTHAGSLVETMRKIIEATKAVTPDLRSSLVEKILGVVHLQKFPLTDLAIQGLESMILPAIWRNAHGSANFFVSDGLGAILPRRRSTVTSRPACSCRGRLDFAEVLLGLKSATEWRSGEVESYVKHVAMKADLEGV